MSVTFANPHKAATMDHVKFTAMQDGDREVFARDPYDPNVIRAGAREPLTA